MNATAKADKYEKDIRSKAYIVMKKIANKQGFFQYYYKILPKFKTNKAAFEAVNLLHKLLFGEFRYSTYEAFKKAKNRNFHTS